ncbi:MAG: MFS transporter [Caulobacteraceae bacterium]
MSGDAFFNRPPLTLATKLAYGSGSVAYGVAFAGLSGAVLQIYLNQVLGLAPLVVGASIMVSLMVDAVLDPLIGQWSDKLRTPWGRRHPLMYAAAAPVAVFFCLLWNAPRGLGPGALIAFTLAMMIAVRVSVSLYEIPSNALTPELTPSYDERTTLQSYRWFFGIIGGAAIGMVLNLVFLRTSAANPAGILNRAGYAHWAFLAAAAMLISILISTRGTHDQIRYLPRAARQTRSFADAAREIRLTLTNRSLLALMLGGVLGGVGGGIQAGLSIYLFTHFWGLDPSQIGLLVPLGSVGSIMAVFLAPPLARRFGKKAATIGLFLVSVVTTAGPIFLRLVHIVPPNGSAWITPILIADGVVNYTVAIVGYILVGSMMADVVEDAAVRSGARSEGLLYAVNGLLPKFTGGIGAFVAGVLLTLVHFPAHALKGTVAPALMTHLVVIYLPLTAGLSLASIAVLGLYRIDRRVHEENLASLREAAAVALAGHGMEAAEAGEGAVPLIARR